MFDYDKTSADSILAYAKKLEGQTFQNIFDRYYAYFKLQNKLIEKNNEDTKAKGQLGNFLEEYYFGYKPNSDQEPDFPEAGVELKQTCVDIKKNGDYTAGERLSITNISFENPIEIDFYKSHAWDKMRLILLIHYLRDKSIPRLQNKILFANLFTPPQQDLKIIIDDYNAIVGKILAGRAHEISEGDTVYLGACTKGATAEKSLRPQYYGDHTPAKKRNFCFKRSYMDYVLHTYVLNDAVPYEPILSDNYSLQNKTFEDIIIERLVPNYGSTDKRLCEIYERIYNNNKAQWSDLAYRMLGIKGNHAEEFVKANIVVREIRIEENGKNKEHLPLPTFKFMELAEEEWDDSTLYQYLSETKFLFVIFRKHGDTYTFEGAKFWNMPMSDLDGEAHDGWEAIKDKIVNGIEFTYDAKGTVSNNLPKPADNKCIHIRPHANKSAYLLSDGFTKGDIHKDANILPDGQWMTTQSFWLNKQYILDQLIGKGEE